MSINSTRVIAAAACLLGFGSVLTAQDVPIRLTAFEEHLEARVPRALPGQPERNQNRVAWYDQFVDDSMERSTGQWQDHYLHQERQRNQLVAFQQASSEAAVTENVVPAGHAVDSVEQPIRFQQPWASSPGVDCSALHLGAAVSFLRPFQSLARAGRFDYQAAPRVWGGWTSPDGLGFRGRWFEYNNVRPGHPGIDSYWAVMTDLEFTDRFCVGYWNGIVTGGVRYAELEEFNNATTGIVGSVGPVIGYDASRLFLRDWYLYSVGRAALMFGDCSAEGVTFGIFEMQIGTEWRYWCRDRSYAFIRGGWEGQWWSGASNDAGEDFGLLGGIVATGVTW